MWSKAAYIIMVSLCNQYAETTDVCHESYDYFYTYHLEAGIKPDIAHKRAVKETEQHLKDLRKDIGR